MHSSGFALSEGVFSETKEGICRNKDKKASFKNSKRARVKAPYSKQEKRLITCKYAQCSGGIQLHMMRSAMRCRTWWFRTVSPTRLWWKPVTAADGSTFDADVVFFDPSSRARVVLEVSIVTIGSDTSLGPSPRRGG